MSWKEIFSGKSPRHLPEIDLPKELALLKARGWIESHRKGDTGIGKTIEDCLGIAENNSGEPDCTFQGVEIEIKGRRAKTKSMLTLFTLEPRIRKLNDVELMKKYGYTDKKGRQALKNAVTPYDFNPQGLKIGVDKAGGAIMIIDKNGNTPWIWTVSDFHLKLHNLCIVYAHSKEEAGKEYFRIEKAIMAKELNDEKFFELIDEGKIKIDLRMHLKETGSSRNRGTAFRVISCNELLKCYQKVEIILGSTTLDARNPE